jgi:RNA polymerase sigma-70 factor, ECF subfamily
MTLTPAGRSVDVATGRGFDACYAANYDRLTAQLYAYIGDLTEAQDVVQEAFTRAWPRWDTIEQYDDPVAWVRRVAWNLARSRWRRVATAVAFARRQRPEYTAGPTPDRVALVAALATLPVVQRRAMILHYLGGRTVSEIAEDCDTSEGTVKSWLHRGRGALATYFGDGEGGGL